MYNWKMQTLNYSLQNGVMLTYAAMNFRSLLLLDIRDAPGIRHQGISRDGGFQRR